MRIATRGSALARWQAERVGDGLVASGACDGYELVVVSTGGDRDKSSPLHQIGGKGIFVKEVQHAVLFGDADVAVHSAKDLPALTPDGLAIGAVLERGDPRDALVGTRLADLAPGATVATGSVRRRAQLRALRPDLVFAELRGNMDTRLAAVDRFDAIVVAHAALDRLGLQPAVVDPVDVDAMVPQVGQATIAVEHRADDGETGDRLARINAEDDRRRWEIERAFLVELGGDCSLPAGAHARTHNATTTLTGFLAADSLERATQRSVVAEGPDAGRRLADELRAAVVGRP